MFWFHCLQLFVCMGNLDFFEVSGRVATHGKEAGNCRRSTTPQGARCETSDRIVLGDGQWWLPLISEVNVQFSQYLCHYRDIGMSHSGNPKSISFPVELKCPKFEDWCLVGGGGISRLHPGPQLLSSWIGQDCTGWGLARRLWLEGGIYQFLV